MIKQFSGEPSTTWEADGEHPCACGFSPEECTPNPCLRKKQHLAGLTLDSKWPEVAPVNDPLEGAHSCISRQESSHQSGVIAAPEAKDFGADAADLITRLKNRAATALAVGNSVPEYALPREVIELLKEAADQLEHQVMVALAWRHTARSIRIELRDLERNVR